MEGRRAEGQVATQMRYLRTTLGEYFAGTDRKDPALTLERPGVTPVHGIFVAIIQQHGRPGRFGPWPVDPCPRASYDTGLDLFAPPENGRAPVASDRPGGWAVDGFACRIDEAQPATRTTRRASACALRRG